MSTYIGRTYEAIVPCDVYTTPYVELGPHHKMTMGPGDLVVVYKVEALGEFRCILVDGTHVWTPHISRTELFRRIDAD